VLQLGRLLALATNIRLGWKGVQGTNTLAYYENPLIADKKFYNIGRDRKELLMLAPNAGSLTLEWSPFISGHAMEIFDKVFFSR
jgi:hypothetical protein